MSVDEPRRAVPSLWESWWTRRYLNGLARVMRRYGWSTTRRYGGASQWLRVYSERAPCISESVTVARRSAGDHVWWFRAGTGAYLAPCTQVDRAADELSLLLTPWVRAALARGGE